VGGREADGSLDDKEDLRRAEPPSRLINAIKRQMNRATRVSAPRYRPREIVSRGALFSRSGEYLYPCRGCHGQSTPCVAKIRVPIRIPAYPVR